MRQLGALRLPRRAGRIKNDGRVVRRGLARFEGRRLAADELLERDDVRIERRIGGIAGCGSTISFLHEGTTATAAFAASAIGSSGVPWKQNSAFASLSRR